MKGAPHTGRKHGEDKIWNVGYEKLAGILADILEHEPASTLCVLDRAGDTILQQKW
jgi:hypothetical protein